MILTNYLCYNYLFDTKTTKKFNGCSNFFTFHFSLFTFFRNFAHHLSTSMKRILYIWPILLLALFACKGEKTDKDGVYQATDTLPMLITQVQKCSRLYTAEVKVHKIITHDDVIRLRGSLLQKDFNFKVPLGERKIAIPMDATLKAYIDFSQFSEKNVERSGDKITILLPEPKVVMTSSKINQKEIREYVALSRAHFSDAEMANYEQQGRAAIIQSIPQLGIFEIARENSARILVPMLTELGYQEENITIAYRKEYGVGDLKKLLEFIP